jgi:hypothetical protein
MWMSTLLRTRERSIKEITESEVVAQKTNRLT